MIITLLLLVLINLVISSFNDFPHSSCNVDDIAENDCNRCICTPDNVYNCSPKKCNKNNTDNTSKDNLKSSNCEPNMTYTLNTTTCICNKNGRWPHNKCYNIFNSLRKVPQKCEPNSYVIIDCNVCHCGPKGEIETEHCTRNVCDKDEKTKTRRSELANNVYGNCEAKHWYSLAPCQFCFCVNKNKLVCNTGNAYSTQLQLGNYNLTVCGKDLIKDAIELIPENHALRQSDKTTTDDIVTTTTEASQEKHSDTKEVNVDNVDSNPDNKAEKSEKAKEEYYSESEEVQEKQVKKNVARQGASTLLPYEEDDDFEDNRNSDEFDRKEEAVNSDNELTVSVESQALSKPDVKEDSKLDNDTMESGPFKDLLRIGLPKVLDKVFSLALRKSMVKLTSNSKCTPGSITVIKCNTCFCLKNGKLLCTNKVCE